MPPARVDFYDPLYDFVTFEEAAQARARAFLDAGFGRAGAPVRVGARTHGESITAFKPEKLILPFLFALEVTRQTFLHQSNLAFLVYPSATHSRFGHAVGACYLGFVAAQRVAVGAHGHEPKYLAKFLEDTSWREEFYLALLLHDVGHFPFSHTLEADRELWELIRTAPSHEIAACELIRGKGPFFEAALRRGRSRPASIGDERPHLWELFKASPKVDHDAICYLITGDDRHLGRKPAKKKAELRLLHDLVSGLLDLDRIDHYRRDSYFTGLRMGSGLNFPSLLAGLTIVYDSQGQTDPELRLSASAIGHAIALLQTGERLTEDCFEHPENVAYEAMLQDAVNLFVCGDDFHRNGQAASITDMKLQEVYDLLTSTDDEFLCRLEKEGSEQVRGIVFKIRHRIPYLPVARLRWGPDARLKLSEVRNTIADLTGVLRSDVGLRASKSFGRDPKTRSEEWLDLHRLRDAHGKSLLEGRYARQLEHFKDVQEDVSQEVWVFGTDRDSGEKLRSALNKIVGQLRCQPREL